MGKKIVVGGLLEHEGKFVFVREGEGDIAGKVNLASGGWESPETFEEGALREALEETGLQAKVVRKIGVYHTLRKNGQEVEKHLFHLQSVGGALKKGKGISELLHLSLEDFEKIPEHEQRESVNRLVVHDFRVQRWHKEGESFREY